MSKEILPEESKRNEKINRSLGEQKSEHFFFQIKFSNT